MSPGLHHRHAARARAHASQAGFTLVEAAITIALVGLVLSTTLQILQGSKLSAAHTRDVKIARTLALTTLGEISAGRMWDDLTEEGSLAGSYAEVDYPGFYWELVIGENAFMDTDGYGDDDPDAQFDNWAYRREVEYNQQYDSSYGSEEEEEEEETEPFQKVRIKVTLPKYGELNNEITLEQWIPWAQVYETDLDEEAESTANTTGANMGGEGR